MAAVKKIGTLTIALAIALLLAACTSTPASSPASTGASAESHASTSSASSSSAEAAPELVNCPITHDEKYGGVYAEISTDDFNALGFAYGDSLNIAFSNGYVLEDIPYYSGFYVGIDEPLVYAPHESPRIRITVNYGANLWETAGLQETDTVTVTLAWAGAYLMVQEALDIAYTDERADYESDIVFANFRALSGGKLKENMVYRSASPVYKGHNRAPYANALMAGAGVQFVLDLSDSDEEITRYLAEDKEQGVDVAHFASLRESGKVAALSMGANYRSDAFKQVLAKGLSQFAESDGPYLVHCIEGKDRTGFVCALLEGLAGATYQEIVDDYMVTYANYYGITLENDPLKYEVIRSLNLDAMLRYIANVDESADLSTIDYTGPARDYLRSSGMTDAQIDVLLGRIAG